MTYFCYGALLFVLFASSVALAQPIEVEPRTMDTVVVTATGFEQAVRDAPASITIITREELETRAYPDISEALKDVPGVMVTGGAGFAEVSIRGMDPQYTLFLVDGRRQNSREARFNGADTRSARGVENSWLPPIEAIERIEIIRGAMSSLYGSEAMGGVVNIITRKVSRTWHGSLQLSDTVQADSSAGDTHAGSAYLSGPLVNDLLGLQVNANAQRRQEDDMAGGFAEQKQRTGSVKLSLTPHRNHDVVADLGYNQQQRRSTPGKSVDSATGTRQEFVRHWLALQHLGRWDGVYSNSHVQRDQTHHRSRSVKIRNTEFNSQWTLPVLQHMLSFGGNYRHESLQDVRGNVHNPDAPTITRNQWALFSEDEWSLRENVALTTGLRLNHDENYGNQWTPRLYVLWHGSDALSIKGGISTGFKAPNLRESAANWGQQGSGRNGVTVGNPDLKAENSVSEEIGVVWSQETGFSVSFTAFNTHFKDKITSRQTCRAPTNALDCHIEPGDRGYSNIREYYNVEKAFLRGVETSVSRDFNAQWHVSSNYTWTQTEQTAGENKGAPLNNRPRHMLNASVDWMPHASFKAWARTNWRSKTLEMPRGDQRISINSYAFTDVGMQYLHNHWTLALAVYNLTDKQVSNTDVIPNYDGRRYWLSATVKF